MANKGRVSKLKSTIITTTALCLGIACIGISTPLYAGSQKITDARRFLQKSSESLSTDERLRSTLDDVVIPRKTEIFLTLQ